jgi:tRNA-specific 2-thiouridylase
MSGGVDSSVAAWLLREAGHEVIGLFMRHGQTVETACSIEKSPGKPTSTSSLPIVTSRSHKQGCCSADDAQDARRVADLLDIPFYALNFEAEFGRIMDYFVDEYTAGRTPNPCVMCNNWLKFGKLAEYADSVGADYIASGHYARMVPAGPGEPPALVRGVDASKDQSYVLFGIERALLPRILFPVGEYDKPQIREFARGLGMRVADKKDSQEICFVSQGDYAEFVRRRRGEIDLGGEIVTTEGEVVGHHTGIENFTIGQRKGLGVAFGEPRYVVRLDADARRVVIGQRDDLARDRIVAGRVNWLIDEPAAPLRCEVKIRYLSQPVPATITPREGGRIEAVLDEPKHGVAPGQALVCYAGDRVLGGGWIE